MDDAARGHVSDINSLKKGWQNMRKQAKLQEASIALQALGLEIAQALAPVFNIAARGISGVAHQAAIHPNVTTHLVRAGAGAAAGLQSLGSSAEIFPVSIDPGRASSGQERGRLKNKGHRGRLANSGVRGASPQLPLYVTVAGTLLVNGSPTGVPAKPGDLPRRCEANLNWMKGLGTAGGAARVAGVPIGVTAGLLAEVAAIPFLLSGDTEKAGPGTALAAAQKRFGRNVTGIQSVEKGKMKGELWLVLETKGADGKKHLKRVKAPMDWVNGSTPSQGGKKAKARH